MVGGNDVGVQLTRANSDCAPLSFTTSSAVTVGSNTTRQSGPVMGMCDGRSPRVMPRDTRSVRRSDVTPVKLGRCARSCSVAGDGGAPSAALTSGCHSQSDGESSTCGGHTRPRRVVRRGCDTTEPTPLTPDAVSVVSDATFPFLTRRGFCAGGGVRCSSVGTVGCVGVGVWCAVGVSATTFLTLLDVLLTQPRSSPRPGCTVGVALAGGNASAARCVNRILPWSSASAAR